MLNILDTVRDKLVIIHKSKNISNLSSFYACNDLGVMNMFLCLMTLLFFPDEILMVVCCTFLHPILEMNKSQYYH